MAIAWEATSGAFPNAHSQTSPEEHVEQVLDFMGHLEPKPLTDHHMPRTAKLLIHGLLDHFGSTLKIQRTSEKESEMKACRLVEQSRWPDCESVNRPDSVLDGNTEPNPTCVTWGTHLSESLRLITLKHANMTDLIV